MKIIANMRRLTIFFFAVVLLVTSCTRENSGSGNSDQTEEFASQASAEADAESELVFNDVFDNVIGVNDFVGIAGTGVFSGRSATSTSGGTQRTDTVRCFTITTEHYNGTLFPVRVTLDFGQGCLGRDGHYRSGKIITVYTGRLVVPGSKATTTFDNFYIDSIHVEGVHEISNIGTQNELKLKVVIENAKLSKPSGNYIEWNSRKTITRLEGNATPLPFDDIFKIEGTASGKVKRGNILVAWNTEIIEPLIKKFVCRWIVKGQIKSVRLNQSGNSPWVSVLNYGNGNCDNKAVLTINGHSFEITLP